MGGIMLVPLTQLLQVFLIHRFHYKFLALFLFKISTVKLKLKLHNDKK